MLDAPLSCLRCISLLPVIAVHMPTQLKIEGLLHLSHEETAVADQLARALEQHGPEPESIIGIARSVAANPIVHFLESEWRGIVLHCDRVAENGP